MGRFISKDLVSQFMHVSYNKIVPDGFLPLLSGETSTALSSVSFRFLVRYSFKF